MAAANCLWGAPRIHGELLKLGIAVSERTVSRYLRGRPTTRSQTWRTFFANLLGDRTFARTREASPVDSAKPSPVAI
jgi:heme oxygenase